MSEKTPKPPLRIVGDPSATPPSPASTFAEAGARLWRDVQSEFDVSDIAGRTLLEQACRAADRAESLAMRISEDGALLRTKTGMRAHPLLAPELAARSFIVKTLLRLGINYEPVHLKFGRPPGA